ncbi:MAG: hypothetical protein LIO65_00295 [Odoribacter sp.]|nr:hypothetical protein [Odoribacter sp.]
MYSSTTQAQQSGLTNNAGETYRGGDVRIVDQNKDNIINQDDRVILGSALPDYFGAFYTQFRYKNFSLLAEFSFSQGNKAYNAVRRYNEGMKNYNNQSSAVLNRWQLEGQITDIPRAEYGDSMNNNAFLSRWIEDASYLKIKNITFSYSFDKTLLGFFKSGTLYVTGENLHTFTKYLGLDPEFAYSYDDAYLGFDYAKVMLPRSVKFGVNLKF